MTLEERLNHYLNTPPKIDPSAYIAKGAIVIGSITLKKNVSIWHSAVLRGDINNITIDEGSNIQDGSVVHLADDYGVTVGKFVTVGHSAVIHACTIQDECLIGMNATILDGAVIGKQSIIGAGALVTKGSQIPEGSLVLGAPAKVIRPLTKEERLSIKPWADKYVLTAQFHKSKFSTKS
ncbi:MAG: gamma carbonic anhydrase family protein [Opitutae bacterium]|jgi:carbonic anhydrase/acetyltransferase-like protein (isoleucine patch superfamily)|nr:gamma carbonic anhydrase family protein [Opitutae bacterium]